MPADAPQIGEVWALPRQPTLTTSGEGGRAVIVDISESRSDSASRVSLISELSGRQLVTSVRSFQITWGFVRALSPQRCCQHLCQNPAWFRQLVDSGDVESLCFQHHHAGTRIYFDEQQVEAGRRCPACDAPIDFPGSGNMVMVTSGVQVHTCGRCRRDWARLTLQSVTPIEVQDTIRRIRTAVNLLECHGFNVRIRMGSEAHAQIRQALGTMGDPPQLEGVPITVAGEHTPLAIYIIGHQPQEVRGVSRLGGQPDRCSPDTLPTAPIRSDPPFTNAPSRLRPTDVPRDLAEGAVWWHKTVWQQAHIVQVGTNNLRELFVKFRADGALSIMLLGDFLTYYQERPLPPPCDVGEEWVDSSGKSIRVIALDATLLAATVSDSSSQFLCPYGQFSKWRKIVRRSIYERLVEESDDSV